MEEDRHDKDVEGNGKAGGEGNGVPSPAVPSKKKQKQVHGILKSGKKGAKTSGVVWDEDNLIFNESHKSATMKIDEPPTPYNKEYDSAEDDEDESSTSEKDRESKSDDDDRTAERAPGTRRNRDEINTEEAARAHFDEVTTALEESTRRPARAGRPRFSSDEDTTEDDGEGEGVNRAEFKKKRMQHYNEWKKLQEFRKSNDPSEGEEDEEEEDDDKDRDDDDTRTARALRT